MMNRRNAIKNLSLGIGYVVSVPSVLSVMQSCTEGNVSWNAVFFSKEEQHLVNHIVDIILPSSDLPGGIELNLPQFIDKMCEDLLNDSDKKWFKKGSRSFSEALRNVTGKSALKSSREDIKEVFSIYFDLESGEQQKIVQAQKQGVKGLTGEELEAYALYKCLFAVREFALLGYFTSEKIGTEVLNFDPIPGGYSPCIPLSEVGNAWTI